MDACIAQEAKHHAFTMEKVVDDCDVGGGLSGCVFRLTWCTSDSPKSDAAEQCHVHH